jgi:hypothetical protein
VAAAALRILQVFQDAEKSVLIIRKIHYLSEDSTMKKSNGFISLALLLALPTPPASEAPQADISNGLLKAKLYLPDAEKGFYRGTRFDWAGVISSLEFQGHRYFGQWFTKHDPKVRDIAYDPTADGFAASTESASLGPIEEFTIPQGYKEAKAGDTFIKIGVGVLRKPEESSYSQYNRYAVVDAGKWTVRKKTDAIEFQQEIREASGFGYVYRKTVRLSKDKPELVLTLKNTGRRPIDTPVYNHNFFVIDDQPTGPDFVIKVPFKITAAADKSGLAAARGNEIIYLRELVKDERASLAAAGFSTEAKDYDLRIENRKSGAGVRITADRPLTRLALWSPRRTLCPEPFISVRLDPGKEFTWRIVYAFYTL